MIHIMHVLCTGMVASHCVAKEKFPLTMVRWTVKVFFLYFTLHFNSLI